jgi:hypothetical protein
LPDTVFIPDDGITKALQNLIASGQIWDGCWIRLFTNNITPSDASVVGDFTEATWSGYGSIQLTAANWAAVSVSAHVATAAYTVTIAFTRTVTGSAASNYGWYVTDAGKTKVFAAARFLSAPLTVTAAGDAVVLSNLKSSCQSVN